VPAPSTDSSERDGASKHAPGLYIVATPIGNARDITLRALDVLAAAHVVACEDSRVTGGLLVRYGIKQRLITYHEHNAETMRPVLLEELRRERIVALVSDAGTPLVSDPGYKLVREALAEGIRVTPLPGPSAVLAALTVAGLPTDRFLFAGFLPAKRAARRTAIAGFAAVDATLVVLESARRLPSSLADLAERLGGRPAAVARELTKLYEEVRRDTLPALAAHYAEGGAPKGEVVIVIGPPAPERDTADPAEAEARLREALATMRPTEAAAAVAAETGVPRRELYARAVRLKAGE